MIPVLSRLFIVLVMLWGAPMAFGAIEFSEATFSWRPEVEPLFQIKRLEMRGQYSGVIDLEREFALYHELAKPVQANVDLTAWHAKSGPAPLELRVRILASNTSETLSRPQPVLITLYGKTGQYRVDPKTILVDLPFMRRTARWQKLGQIKGKLPALAPSEEYTWISDPYLLGQYLARHRALFPLALKAVVQLGRSGSKTIQIPMTPDHVALEQIFAK